MPKTMLRGCPEAIDSTCQSKCYDPRSRETKYICSLCLSNAILFRPICQSPSERRRKRPRSIDVVLQVDLSRSLWPSRMRDLMEVSTSLVGSQHSWRGCKIAPCFAPQGGAPQYPQEVVIPCPLEKGLVYNETCRTLQAVWFSDKKVPGLSLDIDEDFQASQCFTEVIRGYRLGVVEPAVMLF